MALSFLKSVGKKLAGGIKVVGTIAPTVAKLTPTPVDDAIAEGFQAISGVIVQVEMLGQVAGLSGADKLRIATPIVSNAILASPIMQGKKIADAEKFNKALSGLVGNAADLLNSLKAE